VNFANRKPFNIEEMFQNFNEGKYNLKGSKLEAAELYQPIFDGANFFFNVHNFSEFF
jgi:hypothetical protein